jgi:Xaa-Pro aminopeptidase
LHSGGGRRETSIGGQSASVWMLTIFCSCRRAEGLITNLSASPWEAGRKATEASTTYSFGIVNRCPATSRVTLPEFEHPFRCWITRPPNRQRTLLHARPSSYADRLKALREQLKADRLDGFVVPLTDEHMSEYVGSYAQRLAWLTGFEGSAGSAAVLPEEAAIFTDGRYTLQVRSQVDGKHWSYQSVPETSVADWLKEHAGEGGRIGYDPWLHTRDWVKKARGGAEPPRRRAGPVERNPIDARSGRPARAVEGALVRPAGRICRQNAAEKRPTSPTGWQAEADAAVLSALDSIAWTFNVRGQTSPTRRSRWPMRSSIPTAPPTCSSPGERSGPTSASISATAFACTSATSSNRRLAGSAARRSRSIPNARCGDLRRARETPGEDPAASRSDRPSQGDQEPGRDCRPEAAQARDGAAVAGASSTGSTRSAGAASTSSRPRTSSSASPRMARASRPVVRHDFRRRAERRHRPLPGPSETNRKLEPGTLYLVDSGGQYVDGTTDITRTVPIGEPTDEMRDRFTRVLKGHIAIATALFPRARAAASSTASPAAAVGGRPRLRPWHRPRRRQLPRGPRRAAADLRRRPALSRAATSRCRPA